MTEAELVTRAQAGDRTAFGELYDAYLPKIYDFALGMLRNRADAEDVASDTFLRAVEKLGSLKDPEAFRGWLYAIARNRALSVAETRRRAVPTAEHDESAATLEASSLPDPAAGAEAGEIRELVWDAAATLNPRDHQVFELTVRHGMSSSEVAEVLDVRPAYAYILTNRLKGSVEESLEAVLLARTGRADCAELDGILTSYGDEASPRVRKAVTRHAKGCEACGRTKRTKASVPTLLQGMAFAQPSQTLAADLASRIDSAWPPSSGGGSQASSLGRMAGAVSAVVVLTAALVGLAAQSVDEAERVTEVEPAVEQDEGEPEATPSETPEPPRVTRRPAATPEPTPLVVIITPSGEPEEPTPRPSPTPLPPTPTPTPRIVPQ